MRKRERENPCGVCGHYHKYEEGEVCGICGHRPPVSSENSISQSSAFPSEILKDFLYLGSYDNASRSELLKTQGISRILNTVPACQTLYKNSFTYHCLEDGNSLQFDDAIQFLEQCERDKARVLVHCMSGKSRSPSIVIAYLMKSKGWRLAQSHQWVKDRRNTIDLSSAVYQQLVEFEKKVFGSNGSTQIQSFSSPSSLPLLGFGTPNASATAAAPAFNQSMSTSIFERPYPLGPQGEFIFGASQPKEQGLAANNTVMFAPTGAEAPMDSI